MSAEADHGRAAAGGEPTAGPWSAAPTEPAGQWVVHSMTATGPGAHQLRTVAHAYTAEDAYLIASAPTAAARVAGLEGMLAAARDDLRDQLKDAYVAGGVAVLEWAMPDAPTDDLDEGGYDYAAQAITQLDKEAGGK